jgi:hypothetical protein
VLHQGKTLPNVTNLMFMSISCALTCLQAAWEVLHPAMCSTGASEGPRSCPQHHTFKSSTIINSSTETIALLDHSLKCCANYAERNAQPRHLSVTVAWPFNRLRCCKHCQNKTNFTDTPCGVHSTHFNKCPFQTHQRAIGWLRGVQNAFHASPEPHTRVH